MISNKLLYKIIDGNHSLYIYISGRDRRSTFNSHARTKEKSQRRAEERTNLVEVDARQGLLDVRLEVIPCSRKGDVGLVRPATTTSEEANNTALPVEDDGARVAVFGEGTTPTVWHNGSLEGREFGLAEVAVPDKGFEPIDPADGRACGHAVLDDGHRGVAVGVELRGLTYFALGHGARDLEQPVLGVLVASPVVIVGKHEVSVGWLVDLAPCHTIKYR